jgi:hypothetical protein
MIWLSVNRDFFISVDPFLWKKFYFSALRNFGGITASDAPRLFKAEPTVAAAANQWRIFSQDGSCRVITFAPARTETQVRDDYPACAALVEIASTEPACALCKNATRYGNCSTPVEAGLADRFCLVARPLGGTDCRHFSPINCSHQTQRNHDHGV